MAKLVLVPNNRGSSAARDLAKVLSEKVGHKVWLVRPDRIGHRTPFMLRSGTDKLTQLQRFENAGVAHPIYTTDRRVAVSWLPDTPVVCRTVLHGSQGVGIIIGEDERSVVDAPLYTQYFKKKREYRVHVLNGEVIDVQEKRARAGFDGKRDTRIRNLANGYVFCRDAIVEPAGLRELAIRATQSLDYALGAVDIAYNEHHDNLVVFEVNSNPGMQGTTLQKYADAITTWYREQA